MTMSQRQTMKPGEDVRLLQKREVHKDVLEYDDLYSASIM
jgi:hypothetical protein